MKKREKPTYWLTDDTYRSQLKQSCLEPGQFCDPNKFENDCCYPMKCSTMFMCLPQCLSTENCGKHKECLYGDCVFNPFAKFKPYKTFLMKKCEKSCSEEINNFECVENYRKPGEKHCRMSPYMFSASLGPESCASGMKSIDDYCLRDSYLTDLSNIVKIKSREFRRLRNSDGLDDLANYVMDILENKIKIDKDNPPVKSAFDSLHSEVKALLDPSRKLRKRRKEHFVS